MTWSARITKVDGSVPEGKHNACEVCLHAQKNKALPERVWRPCNIPSIGNQLGGLLTSIDVGADGHMAGGNALLQCQGFEPIPSENTEVTHP